MFRLGVVDQRAVLVTDHGVVDLALASGDPTLSDPMVAIARHRELHVLSESASTGITPALSSFGICVPRPSKVFAIGLNYRTHAAESNLEIPVAPLAFTKFPSSLNSATGDIELSGDRVDWEVELVVVIGDRCRFVTEEDAWGVVAGLTLGQDISDRTVQMLGKPPQFSLGKSFDTFAPIGPMVVSVNSFPNPDDVGIGCSVAGVQQQSTRTADLIFAVPALIAYLSGICTLEPGDLIFTGTPGGVGQGRNLFLKVGDVVESTAELIGTMTNTCVVGAAR